MCMILGQKIWLLLIFLMATWIPLMRGINTQQLGQLLFVGFTVLLFLMRRLRMDWRFTALDFWRFALFAMVVQVYMRNPVGLNIIGSGSVGGRPYFLVVLGLTCGFLLSRYRVSPTEIRWALWASIAGAILNFPLSMARGRALSSGSLQATEAVEAVGGMDNGGSSRIGRFKSISEILSKIVVMKVSPLRAGFHPLWAFIIILSMGLAAASGYRNAVAWTGLIYLFGIAYWGGAKSVVISAFIGAVALLMLAIVNVAFPLPANVQRALSPFPGTWEKRYKNQAEVSTEWRVEMWTEALTSDRWIKNKILGDGLGFTRAELRRMQDLKDQGQYKSLSGLTQQQESMLVTGSYHSGPVHTIRIVGYAGLVVLIVVFWRVGVEAHRMISRCRGTEWWGLSLFFGIPVMAYPIFFLFVFGTFEEAITYVFVFSGLIDLLQKNLPVKEYQIRRRGVYIPMAAQRVGRER